MLICPGTAGGIIPSCALDFRVHALFFLYTTSQVSYRLVASLRYCHQLADWVLERLPRGLSKSLAESRQELEEAFSDLTPSADEEKEAAPKE